MRTNTAKRDNRQQKPKRLFDKIGVTREGLPIFAPNNMPANGPSKLTDGEIKDWLDRVDFTNSIYAPKSR